jgi:hypothetical protein
MIMTELTLKSAQLMRDRQLGAAHTIAEMKARQSTKIREIGEALAAAGFTALDEQSKVLGLCRSTTWTLLEGNHKSSGLSASIINRMMASPLLPPPVRAKILEYIAEKAAGHYGDNQIRLRRFMARCESMEALILAM